MKAKILQLGLILLGLGVWAMANPVSIQFLSGGPSSPGGVAYFPYTISVNGSSAITVACDDFVGHVDPSQTFNGWISDYTDLSHTLFNGGNATPPSQAYKELAFLYQNILSSGSNLQTAAIQYAMWDLFDSSAPGIDADSTASNQESQAAAAGELDVATDNDNSAFWLNLAAAQDYSKFNFSNFVIYSPVVQNSAGAWVPDTAAGRPQEFIGEVPEPASLALLGTGLLILGFAFRRRLSADGHNLQA